MFFNCSNVQTFLKLEISVFYEFSKVWKPIYRNIERLDALNGSKWTKMDPPGKDLIVTLIHMYVKDLIVRFICEGSYWEGHLWRMLLWGSYVKDPIVRFIQISKLQISNVQVSETWKFEPWKFEPWKYVNVHSNKYNTQKHRNEAGVS